MSQERWAEVDRPTVLVFTQSADLRSSVLSALNAADISVSCSTEEREFLERYRRERPGVVLLASDDEEIRLDLCDALADVVGRPEVILFVCNVANDALVDRAYAHGASDVLPLPLNPALTAARVRFLWRDACVGRELRRRTANLTAAQRIAGIGYWLWDGTTDEVTVSPEAAQILGRDGREQTIGLEAFLDDVHDDDRHRIRRAISELPPGETVLRVEHRLANKDATVSQEAQATIDPLGNLSIIGTIQDISERKRAERHIIRLAYHDELTGLPNRTFLWDSLNRLVASLQVPNDRLALIGVHLTGVHRIIDTFGHEAGDHMLKMVAERLDNVPDATDTLSPEDTLSLDDTHSGGVLLARMTNEGFMFVFTDVDGEDDTWQRARRIQQVLAEPVEIAGHPVVPGACLGMAIYPEHGNNASLLLKNAETAQHQAVASGTGHAVLFTESLHANARERLTIEMALRRAMENETLELHYQPKVDVLTERPVGMEALLRWNDPDLGPVRPDRFISIAEEAGLIDDLGRWVLRTACAQTRAWREAGLDDLRVAVNISADQFVHPDFVHGVRQTLTEIDLPAECLELEITESLLMRDTAVAVRHLTELRSLGIHIALDDFGTGYSSLSYLHRFPLDSLKIDRSFIRDMTVEPESATIVRAIILLSHNLNLRVVAEGVETREQLDELRNLGCEEIQGWYYSKALPPPAFEAWAKDAYAIGTRPAAVGE